MLAMTRSFTPPQTHGVKARRFEVEDFSRWWRLQGGACRAEAQRYNRRTRRGSGLSDLRRLSATLERSPGAPSKQTGSLPGRELYDLPTPERISDNAKKDWQAVR